MQDSKQKIMEVRNKLKDLIKIVSVSDAGNMRDSELYNKLLTIASENKELKPLVEYIILMMDKQSTVYKEAQIINKEHIMELIEVKENMLGILDDIIRELDKKSNPAAVIKNNKVVIMIFASLFAIIFYLVDKELATNLFYDTFYSTIKILKLLL